MAIHFPYRVLDTLHVALSTDALYFYLITIFRDLIGGLENGLWYVSGRDMKSVILKTHFFRTMKVILLKPGHKYLMAYSAAIVSEYKLQRCTWTLLS